MKINLPTPEANEIRAYLQEWDKLDKDWEQHLKHYDADRSGAINWGATNDRYHRHAADLKEKGAALILRVWKEAAPFAYTIRTDINPAQFLSAILNTAEGK